MVQQTEFLLRKNMKNHILTIQRKLIAENKYSFGTKYGITKEKIKRLEAQVNADNLICGHCNKIIELGTMVKKSRHCSSGASNYRHLSCIVRY